MLWHCQQEQLLALCVGKNALHLYLPQLLQLCHAAHVTQADVATIITEWLHALLLVMNESQNMRKSEPKHAVISNRV